jgi:Lar family restriction alleviation protein
MSAPELKPCPFCGGEADFNIGEQGNGLPWHYIECSECSACGPNIEYAAHNIAVKECLAEAWNTRADLCDPMQDERVKALVEAVKGMPQDWYDDNCDCKSCDTLRAALRDMGVE